MTEVRDSLRRAAEILRELASGTTPGPWFYRGETDEECGGALVETDPLPRITRWGTEGGPWPDYPAEADNAADARWIAAVSPAIAESLANVLEFYAGTQTIYVFGGASIYEDALPIADAVIKAAEETG